MKNKYIEMDINIALSILNMKLRDKYQDLQELCDDEEIDMIELLNHFEKNSIFYSNEKNSFIS